LLIGQKLKLWASPLDIKDSILAFIEKWSSRINCWAWDQRWKYRDHHAWIKGYKEWKKKKLKKEPSVSELLQEGMKKQIEAEEKENDILNSKNTTCFKNGAER